MLQSCAAPNDADVEKESEKNAFEKEEVMLISIDNNGVIKSGYCWMEADFLES